MRSFASLRMTANGVVKPMGQPTGFLEIERKDRPYEKVEARLKALR